jgi:hypothetical protein
VIKVSLITHEDMRHVRRGVNNVTMMLLPFLLTMTPHKSVLSFISLSTLALGTHALTPFVVSTSNHPCRSDSRLFSNDWSSFSALDDDEDFDVAIDQREYAAEEDSQELKAQVGSSLEPPTIENDAEPIFVPIGSQLELDEPTVLGILSACREEIGTMFGYTAENRGVGITGGKLRDIHT